MKKIVEKHVSRLYYNKYTHMIQLEHILFPKYELRSFMRAYGRKGKLTWSAYMQTRFAEMKDKVKRDNMTINYRGDFVREDNSGDRSLYSYRNTLVKPEDVDSAEQLVNFLLQHRDMFDLGTARIEHRRVSFFSNSSALQDELLKNFAAHVVCIGKPASDTHKQALIEHAAEDSVMRKIVCKKRLKNDRYRFSIELKSMRDMLINNLGLFSMIKDLVEQGSCLPNAGLQCIIDRGPSQISSSNTWNGLWHSTSRLWFEDDSSLGLLILGLGNTYIRCIEEYRVVA